MRMLILSDAFAARVCETLRARIKALENELLDPAMTEFGRWVLRDQIAVMMGTVADLADEVKPLAEASA